MNRRILLTGAGGIVGQTWQEVWRRSMPAGQWLALTHRELDIADREAVNRTVAEFKPDVIVNAAAYTRVDDAETDREAAYRANVTGPELLARAARDHGAILLHYSTDYVFDGTKRQPYREEDPARPINYYGLTKWMGEEKIRQITPAHFIIRTAWVYGAYGHNFIRLVLQLAARHDTLRFVNDQTGSPTAAADLVAFSQFLLENPRAAFGTYHCSHEGEVTRYDQAKAIVDYLQLPVKILPVPSSAFPQKARRPAYSVLSKDKIRKMYQWPVKHWKQALEQTLEKHYK